MISLSKFVHNFKCSCRRRREFSVLLVYVNGKEEKESSSYLIHVHNLYKKQIQVSESFFKFTQEFKFKNVDLDTDSRT